MLESHSSERTHIGPLAGEVQVGGLVNAAEPGSESGFESWDEQKKDESREPAVFSREGLRSLVDRLDQATPEVLPFRHGDIVAHKRGLMQLAELCGRYDILPTRLTLTDIVLTSEHPVAAGGFADVCTASYSGQDVALKRFRFRNSAQEKHFLVKERACREIVLWCRLKHVHVLPFLGVDISTFPSRLCLVTPWMANGTVDSYIKRKELSSAEIHNLLLGVSLGLQYLHENDVIHGDIRCSNILISDDCRPLLADFGLSNISLGVTSRTTTSEGSHRWSAPETHRTEFKSRTPATDVYAFGCTCIEAYTGEEPFLRDVPNSLGLSLYLAAGKRHSRPLTTEGDLRAISDALWALIEECMHLDPIGRPALPDVVKRLQALMETHGVLSPPDLPVRLSAERTSTTVLRGDSMEAPDALWDAFENLTVSSIDTKIGVARGTTFTPRGPPAAVYPSPPESPTILRSLSTGYTSSPAPYETRAGVPTSSPTRRSPQRVQNRNMSDDSSTSTSSSQHAPSLPVNSGMRRQTVKQEDTFSDSKDALHRSSQVQRDRLSPGEQKQSGRIRCLALSPDTGVDVACGLHNSEIAVWNLAYAGGRGSSRTLRGHTQSVNAVVYSVDGASIISGSGDRTVRVWDAGSGTQRAVLSKHTSRVDALAVTPDGSRVISGSQDKSLCVWQAPLADDASCALVQQVTNAHAGEITSIAVSARGVFASASLDVDTAIQFWDMRLDAIGSPLRGHNRGVRALCWSPDGRILFSGSQDGTVRIWDLRADAAASVRPPLRGHSDEVFSVAACHDGNRVVSGALDKTIRVFDVRTGTQIGDPLMGNSKAIQALAVTPDDGAIISGAGVNLRVHAMERF